MENLDKIDVLRDRMNVSYETARTALEASNWDVVDAIVRVERDERNKKDIFKVRGSELVEKIKEIVRKGNVTKIKVKHGEKILVEVPVTAGVVGAVLAPELAVIGTVAALVSRCTVEIETFGGQQH